MKFLNGESTTLDFGFGLAGGFGDTSAFGFTIALAFVLAFALGFAVGFAVVDFAAVGFAAAVFFRIFAAICLIRSSPNRWPLVVRGRGPRNEGRVRYQNISAAARKIGTPLRPVVSDRLQSESVAARGARTYCMKRDAQRLGSDNRTIEGLVFCVGSYRGCCR